MATYWVKTSGGNDANDGLSFANARATLASILGKMVSDAAVTGSILNVVADGTHAWPTAETNLTTGLGTSFSDFGYLIRGVSDSSATPAKVTIAPSGAGTHRLFNIQAGAGYAIVRNCLFDMSSQTADAGVYTIGRYQNAGSTSGPVRFEGCGFIVGGTGVTNSAGTRQLFSVITSPPPGTEVLQIEDCYVQNLSNTLHNVGATLSKTVTGCVFFNNVTTSGSSVILSQTLSSGTGGTFAATFNTIYQSIGAQVFAYPYAYNATGTNAGTVNVHSNLVYQETTSGAANVGLITDTGSGAMPFSGTLGNNVLLGGASVLITDLGVVGWYGGSWDGGTDPKSTDQVAFSQAESTIFNAPGSTYAWDALGNGVTLTILKDLRPRLFQTAGLGGTVPGALPASSTDYSAAIVADNTAPDTGDTITVTATALNTGTAATSVLYQATIPTGLTYVSHVASAGTYVPGTGVWTIGSLASASPQTLAITCTVDAAVGTDIVVTIVFTSGDPFTDTDPTNNSASMTISVVVDEDIDPATTPFLDVAPIFAPVLLAEINAILRTKRNRITHHEQRRDYEGRKWREYTSRRLTIAPSTTTPVISSIERADFLILEATDNIEVSVSDGATDQYFPACERLALLDGDFTTLKLRNPSASASVDVLLVVVD